MREKERRKGKEREREREREEYEYIFTEILVKWKINDGLTSIRKHD